MSSGFNPFKGSSKVLGTLYDPIGAGGVGHDIGSVWHKSGIADTLGGVFGGAIPHSTTNLDTGPTAASGDSQVAGAADVQSANQAEAQAQQDLIKKKAGGNTAYGSQLSI